MRPGVAVGQEQRIVAEAALAPRLEPDLALARAGRHRLGAVLVDEDHRAAESRRALGVGDVTSASSSRALFSASVAHGPAKRVE